jgi:hypothetical protein
MTSFSKHLPVGVVLAFFCCFSSAALAEEFHVASAPATVTGNQAASLVLTTNAGSALCKTVNLSGTQASKTQESLEVSVSMSGCVAFGFLNIPIHWNGCSFKWTASGSAHILCTAGKAIEITAPFCTTQVPGQSLSGGATFTTLGAAPNRHIVEHWNFTKLKYIECGTLRENGTWHGSTTTSASSDSWFG